MYREYNPVKKTPAATEGITYIPDEYDEGARTAIISGANNVHPTQITEKMSIICTVSFLTASSSFLSNLSYIHGDNDASIDCQKIVITDATVYATE